MNSNDRKKEEDSSTSSSSSHQGKESRSNVDEKTADQSSKVSPRNIINEQPESKKFRKQHPDSTHEYGGNSDCGDENTSQQYSTTTSKASDFMLSVSPRTPIPFEQVLEAARGVENMALAHEIVLNPSFKLGQQQQQQQQAVENETSKNDNDVSSTREGGTTLPEGFEDQLRKIAEKAFWDVFREKLENRDFEHLLTLIEEIRTILLDLLLPHHLVLRNQIRETLDLELIRQQLVNCNNDDDDDDDGNDVAAKQCSSNDDASTKKCDLMMAVQKILNPYAIFIIQTMAEICAPARDEAVQSLYEKSSDIISFFQNVHEVLKLLKLDMANFRINAIRPVLQRQVIDYEKQKFKKFLELHSDEEQERLMSSTREWLRRSLRSLLEKRSPSNIAATTTTNFSGIAGSSSTESTATSIPTNKDNNQSMQPSGVSAAVPSTSSISVSGGDPFSRINVHGITSNEILINGYLQLLDWDMRHPYPMTIELDRSRLMELDFKLRRLTLIVSIVAITRQIFGDIHTTLREDIYKKAQIFLHQFPDKDLASKLSTLADDILSLIQEDRQQRRNKEVASDEGESLLPSEFVSNLHEITVSQKDILRREFVKLERGIITVDMTTTPPMISSEKSGNNHGNKEISEGKKSNVVSTSSMMKDIVSSTKVTTDNNSSKSTSSASSSLATDSVGCVMKESSSSSSSSSLHPVRKILKSRIFAWLKNFLETRRTCDLPQGWSLAKTDLIQAIGSLINMIDINRAVYGSYYDYTIKMLIEEAEK